MREILFRGKSTGDLNKWIYGYYHFDKSVNRHYICDENSLIRYDVIAETVGQFTGKLDTDNTKIFEGDIVHGKESGYDGIRIKGWDGTRTGNVILDSLGAWAYAINGQSHQMLAYLQKPIVKGNIYENTELINNPKN